MPLKSMKMLGVGFIVTTIALATTVRTQLNRRGRQIMRLVFNKGSGTLSNKIRTKLSDTIRPKTFTWEVFPSDVLQADLSKPQHTTIPVIHDGQPIELNWIVPPSGPGSGGHTTIFRVVKYLQAAGYRNRVYFYDAYGGDFQYYKAIAASYYGLTCDIEDFSLGLKDAHGVIATGWPTAYAAFNAPCAGKRFYFIQDYEPYFYPVGTNSALAETTYRMGFHGITAGRWLSQKLAQDFGMETDWFPFGCDTARYRLNADSERSGIAFYARAGTPRRAVEIGLLALDLFAKRQPDIELHLFGQKQGPLPFRFSNHGVVSPERLSVIYNRCFAGLSLSLTNVSLVPHEMLSCGCIPIVNEADHNRLVLDNRHVRYASLLPHALADAMVDLVTMPDFQGASRRAAESVKAMSWETAGAAVDAALRNALDLDRRRNLLNLSVSGNR